MEAKILRTWLLRAVQLALTVLVTWFVVERVGPGVRELLSLERGALRLRPVPLLLSCVALFAGYAASGVIWGKMVEDLGGGRLPRSDAVRVFMVANLGRYVPGKVWQIAGLAALARSRGVGAATATAAAVLGQGLALLAASLLGLGALGAAPPSVRALAPWIASAAVAVFAVLLLPPVFSRLSRLWFRLARQEAPAELVAGRAAAWFGLYVANWLVYAGAFVLLVRGLGLPAPALSAGAAFAAAYVLGYVMIFAPAGLGVREGFLVALLAPAVGSAAAAVVAVSARVWTTAVEVIPAAAFWLRHVSTAPSAGAPGRAGR